MLCLKCGCEDFAQKRETLMQEFNGSYCYVKSDVCVCERCGFYQLSDWQASTIVRDTLVDASKDEIIR